MLTLLANALFGTQISDVCTGLWGFKRKVIKNIALNSDFFEIEGEIFASCVKNNYKVTEIPIVYRRRRGKGKLDAVAGFRIALKLVGRKFTSITHL
jgi:dolichol-phosphate mannosyltransferase